MRRKSSVRLFIMSSYVLCCLSVALLSMSLGTRSWLRANCSNWEDSSATGDAKFGLFTGVSNLKIMSEKTKIYKIVCLDHRCMYSAGNTKQEREASLNTTLSQQENAEQKSSVKVDVIISSANGVEKEGVSHRDGDMVYNEADVSPISVAHNRHVSYTSKYNELNGLSDISGSYKQLGGISKPNNKHDDNIKTNGDNTIPIMTMHNRDNDDTSIFNNNNNADKLSLLGKTKRKEVQSMVHPLRKGSQSVNSDTVPQLMSAGLWNATVALLCLALFFAVVGAIFGVVNTVISPIEAITGVPGLYIWNGLAAACGVGSVICWGVEYSVYLVRNVLLEDAEAGWTTEGMQHLGYSYWLVVVSAVVHCANCGIIAIGTYERKEKTQYEAPETKPGNIMLY